MHATTLSISIKQSYQDLVNLMGLQRPSCTRLDSVGVVRHVRCWKWLECSDVCYNRDHQMVKGFVRCAGGVEVGN